MESVQLGQKLKQAMNKSGLLRKEIAEKTGVSEQNLYKLIKADDIKMKTLIKLSEVLNVPLDYFLEFKCSRQFKELEKQLEHECTEKKLLKAEVQFYEQQFGILIGQIKDFEESMKEKDAKDGKERNDEEINMFTLITPYEKKRIPLSQVIDTFYQMMILANKPGREGWYLKYSNEFLNIVEVRKSVRKNLHLYPIEIREALTEIIPENIEDEYIDLQKI